MRMICHFFFEFKCFESKVARYKFFGALVKKLKCLFRSQNVDILILSWVDKFKEGLLHLRKYKNRQSNCYKHL